MDKQMIQKKMEEATIKRDEIYKVFNNLNSNMKEIQHKMNNVKIEIIQLESEINTYSNLISEDESKQT